MRGVAAEGNAAEEDGKNIRKMSAFQSFYAIPAVRYLMRGLFHLVRTTLYVLLIFWVFKDKDTLDGILAPFAALRPRGVPAMAVPVL